jgi:hypothetical protein
MEVSMNEQDQKVDQDHHRIAGDSQPESDPKQEMCVIPYQNLPQEILRADGTCHVTMFSAGITTVVNAFIQKVQAEDPGLHLTETEWLERFTKFVEGFRYSFGGGSKV